MQDELFIDQFDQFDSIICDVSGFREVSWKQSDKGGSILGIHTET